VADTFERRLGSGFEGREHDFQQTVGKGHGRIETRQRRVVSEPAVLEYQNGEGVWESLDSVALVKSKWGVGEEVEVEDRYYISSLKGDARQLLEATRTHCEIENCVHWVLDIAFDEDNSPVRQCSPKPGGGKTPGTQSTQDGADLPGWGQSRTQVGGVE
jgi:hypothetical protein